MCGYESSVLSFASVLAWCGVSVRWPGCSEAWESAALRSTLYGDACQASYWVVLCCPEFALSDFSLKTKCPLNTC